MATINTMKVYLNADMTIKDTIGTYISAGSNNASRVQLVTPMVVNTNVFVNFRLPSTSSLFTNVKIESRYMYLKETETIDNDTYYVYEYALSGALLSLLFSANLTTIDTSFTLVTNNVTYPTDVEYTFLGFFSDLNDVSSIVEENTYLGINNGTTLNTAQCMVYTNGSWQDSGMTIKEYESSVGITRSSVTKQSQIANLNIEDAINFYQEDEDNSNLDVVFSYITEIREVLVAQGLTISDINDKLLGILSGDTFVPNSDYATYAKEPHTEGTLHDVVEEHKSIMAGDTKVPKSEIADKALETDYAEVAKEPHTEGTLHDQSVEQTSIMSGDTKVPKSEVSDLSLETEKAKEGSELEAQLNAIENSIVDKFDSDISKLPLLNDIGDNDLMLFRSGGVNYKYTGKQLKEFAENPNNLFLGTFDSYESFIASYPTGSAGERAWVNELVEGNNVVSEYVWDTIDNEWHKTGSGLYVSYTLFQELEQRVIDRETWEDNNFLQMGVEGFDSSNWEGVKATSLMYSDGTIITADELRDMIEAATGGDLSNYAKVTDVFTDTNKTEIKSTLFVATDTDNSKKTSQDILDLANSLATDAVNRDSTITALTKRVGDNETEINSIWGEVDGFDEDIAKLVVDIGKIKTDFMETSDYLEGGEFKDIYLSTLIAKVNAIENTTFTASSVDVLPSLEDAKTNILYLVPNEDGYRDEYLFIDGKWDKIGDTKVDLSEFEKKVDEIEEEVEIIKEQLFYDNVDVESSFIEESTANGREIFDRHDAVVKKISGNTIVSGNFLSLTEDNLKSIVGNPNPRFENGTMYVTRNSSNSYDQTYLSITLSPGTYFIKYETTGDPRFVIGGSSRFSGSTFTLDDYVTEMYVISEGIGTESSIFNAIISLEDIPYQPYGTTFKHSQLKELQSYQNNLVTEIVDDEEITTNQPILLDYINYDVGELTQFDTVELVDDKVILNKATGTYKCTGNEAFVSFTPFDNTIYVRFNFEGIEGFNNIDAMLYGNLLNNVGFRNDYLSGSLDIEQIRFSEGMYITIQVAKSRLSSNTQEGVLEWMKNNLELTFKLTNPNTTELQVKNNIDVVNDGYLKFTETDVALNTTLEYALDTKLEVIRLGGEVLRLDGELETKVNTKLDGTLTSNNTVMIGSNVNEASKPSVTIGDGNGEVVVGTSSFNPQTNGIVNVGFGNNTSTATSSSYGNTFGTSIGHDNTLSGYKAMVVGCGNTASNENSVAFGNNNNNSGQNSTSIGRSNTTSSYSSTAVGINNTASGTATHAFGGSNTASGDDSIAIGINNTASGDDSIAIGIENQMSGNEGIGIGRKNKTSGLAVGVGNTTSSSSSAAFGVYNTASNDRSYAFGSFNSATGNYTCVIGYNGSDSTNGTNTSPRIKLGVSGTNVYLGSGTAVSSDIKDKTDFKDIDNALAFLSKIEGYRYLLNNRETYYIREESTFDESGNEIPGQLIFDENGQPKVDTEAWKAGTKKGTRYHLGVKAQDVYKTLIETYGDDNYHDLVYIDNYEEVKGRLDEDADDIRYHINYTGFTPYLIEAVNELNKENQNLKERLKVIEDKLGI